MIKNNHINDWFKASPPKVNSDVAFSLLRTPTEAICETTTWLIDLQIYIFVDS
jgi:hypothetical protein